MRFTSCLIFTLLAVLSSFAYAQRPNIIIIVVDDLGYADMSFLSHSPADIKTPGIDRIAKQGTYFSNAYATSPICSPSRCGLITGRYQQRWGNVWYGQGGLPRDQLTIPQALKKLGYFTKKIGKTHLNGGAAHHPLDHGFDEFIGFIHHTWDYIRLHDKDTAAYRKRLVKGGLGILNVGPLVRGRGEKVSYEDGFTTRIFTDEAIKTIENGAKNDRPFFIQLEHNAVHMPTYVTHPDYAKRAGYHQPAWDRNAEKWTFPFWDPRDENWYSWHRKWGGLGEVDPLGRKRYLANLMALDDSVARILDSLEKTGQRDNTIVVFLSDNGGTINTYSNNQPLRGYKYMFGEGGVRIPLMISWPGSLPQGQTCSGLTSAMDVFPTVVELAGGDIPDNLDGQSLARSIKNDKHDKGHDHLCFVGPNGVWSIRQGGWKLINSKGWSHKNFKLNNDNIASRAENYSYPRGLMLFNLKDDIGETKDISSEHPARVAAMRTLYEAWQSEIRKSESQYRKKK